MANHHVKLFIVDGGVVYYIHHNTSDPSNDDPGPHAEGPTGDKYKWRARDDGDFRIEFKTESPFKSGAGAHGSPIVSQNSQTQLETLKSIATLTKPFPYTVTFDSGESDDPKIIINNSGGGGGPAKKKSKKKK
jgi:hypothetical protein